MPSKILQNTYQVKNRKRIFFRNKNQLNKNYMKKLTNLSKFDYQFFTLLIILVVLVINLTFGLFLFSPRVMAKRTTTVATDCTIQSQTTAWTKTCTLPKFDKKLGTLLSATIQGSINTETIWKIENRDVGTADFRLTVGAIADFKDPVTGGDTDSLFETNVGGVNISGIVSDQTLTHSLTPFDNTFDSNGASGRTYDGTTPNTGDSNRIYPKIISSKTDSKVLTDPSSLSFFNGNLGDNFTTNISTRGRTVTDYNTTNFTQSIDTIAGATMKIIYEYEAPNVAISFANLSPIVVPEADFLFNLQVQNMETSATPSGVQATLTLPAGTIFDPSTFTFDGWVASFSANVVTLVRNEPMSASLIEGLPIKLRFSNSAPNSILLTANVIIAENDFDLTNNQKSDTVTKNLPPILSTITSFSNINNNLIFKLPDNFLTAVDPNQNPNSSFPVIDFVKNFVITNLPNPESGQLFLDNLGTIPLTLNQVLTIEQSKSLYFKPKSAFVGNVSFGFTANDSFDAKNLPIIASFNLTNQKATGTGQYYYGSGGTVFTSSDNSANSSNNSSNNLANSPNTSQNIDPKNLQQYNSQSTIKPNSDQENQYNSVDSQTAQNNQPSNDFNTDSNLNLEKMVFRVVDNKLLDKNNKDINTDNQNLTDKNGQIDKNTINKIIQNFLEKVQDDEDSGKDETSQLKGQIFIEQNNKIVYKITAKTAQRNEEIIIKLQEGSNKTNEKNNLKTENAQNLIRTGGESTENIKQIIIGVLAILGAIGLLWTYFAKIKKGKNTSKIELGDNISR